MLKSFAETAVAAPMEYEQSTLIIATKALAAWCSVAVQYLWYDANLKADALDDSGTLDMSGLKNSYGLVAMIKEDCLEPLEGP
ncbi:MAG: hypothetical protein F4206_06190 [Gammaproteobacteria bacterium]|nr:hypothetical protein [Gammaproteobacteria bacterium]MYG66304.1 hypothetical protein [Gammaproteobacteria bacterium]